MSDAVIHCCYAVEGCSVEGLVGDVSNHELICTYRVVKCPGRHRMSCLWSGFLKDLVPHLKEKNCVQVASKTMTPAGDVFFEGSVIGLQSGGNIFRHPRVIHWRPVIFVISGEAKELLPYLSIRRTCAGDWILDPRSLAVPSCREKYTVRAFSLIELVFL